MNFTMTISAQLETMDNTFVGVDLAWASLP